MRKLLLIVALSVLFENTFAQSPSDSVTLSVRRYPPAFTTQYWVGQFNNWNSTAWPMSYNGDYWAITRTLKIHTSPAPSPEFGDSVWQYKFFPPESGTTWVTDPLNPESNPNDNSNSILRLSRLFWFQFYGTEVNQQYTRITIGLVHANSDSITSIKFSSGITASAISINNDVTANFDRQACILNLNLSTSVAKSNFIRFVAYNNKGDSVVYSRGGYVVERMLMPAYAKHGVTLPSVASGDSVTFRLRVTGKDYVLLRIAPLGQSLATAPPIVMRKNISSAGDWWMNVKLAPGTYEYLYEIENRKQIYDPWGRYNGQSGSRFTIGSAGLTDDDYAWKTQNYQRPPLNKLIIYELNVGEFGGGYYSRTSSQQGTFSDLMTLLPYLDSLGVNAIEVMPVNDYGAVGRSGHSWGYDINSYFALEPGYGTPRDFKTLVDAAHARGIAIIVDAVFNHLNDTSPLWQMQPDEDANPYFKRCNDLRPNEDQLCFFKDMDHWTNETQELIYDVLKMWIDVYQVDGFRYDYTQGIGWTLSDTTKGILEWANRIAREYSGIYQIAEHLPESPALLYNSGLTSGWHDSFRDEIFDEARFRNRSLSNIENLVLDLGAYQGNDVPSSPNRYANRTEPVNATVTHDEQTLIYEMNTFQSVSLDEAIQRDKLYTTFMFTSLGMPMLWQGMEFSEPRGWLSDGLKLSYRPVQWSYLSTQRGKSHFEYYRWLIRQRRYNPALFNGALRKLKQYNTEKVLVWGFDDAATNSKVMVLSNLSGASQTVTNVPWLATGAWYDIFDQTVYTAGDTIVASFTTPAYTARVFSNRSNTSLGIPGSKELSEVPKQFSLHQNYPNPFNPSTTIKYEVPRESFVSLKIYGILGNEIATLEEGYKKQGYYSVQWNGRNQAGREVASGIYLVRLQAGTFLEVKKMILLR